MRSAVLLVSAGLLTPKKKDHPYARKHRYLNYGLLTLGTLIHQAGHPVRMFHGGFEPPHDFVDRLVALGLLGSETPIFLSLPSHFAVRWAQQFLKQIRIACPTSRIIVGGRWVVGDDSSWIRQKLPETDLVVYGTAELRAADLLQVDRWPRLHQTDRSLFPGPSEQWSEYVDLQYDLNDDFLNYHPSIEVSRGCGMGCSFCEERSVKLTSLRTVKSLTSAMTAALTLYCDLNLRFYLEASWFVPNGPWAEALAQSCSDIGLSNLWRCETRVDSLNPTTLPHLARAGLKVLDLGLESASIRQLTAMKKAPKPSQYLQKASQLLDQCCDLGIWAKVNVMLFAGETNDTVQETMEWLTKRKDQIKGVSVGAVTVYGNGSTAHDYLRELAQFGARPADPASIDRDGYAQLHLSREIDVERASALTTEIAQEFMSDRDYYDLKSFSYLPRNYSYDLFLADMPQEDHDALPFRVGG